MQTRNNGAKPKEWFNHSIAFIIGVGKYDKFEDLPNAVKDAEDIAALLENSLPSYTIKKLLLNGTYGEVDALFKKDVPDAITNENTQVIIYFAGHGFATAKTNITSAAGYILPADASRKNYERFISMQDIYEKLSNLPVRPRHLLLILDCCFAGSFKWNSMTLRGLGTGDDIIYKQRYDRFINSHAWQVLTSSSYNQVSVDSVYENDLSDRGSINNNSPFVKYLKDSLAGFADLNKDGLLTITEIQSYIRDQLEKPDPKSVRQQLQTPMLFPLNVDIHDRGEYLFLLPDCPLNLDSFDISENPYRGLLSYNEDNSDSFFGRTSAITSLKAIIDQNQLTVVYGASGTGKSSLVLAGILPKYKCDYSVLQFSPGKCGLINLSSQLKEIKKESKCLLYIDQLEEIFTQNSTEDQKEFFQKLKDALNSSSDQLKLLVSIRSDFESYLDRTVLTTFWTEQKSNVYPVPVLTSTELREIIVKPATQRLIEFSPPGLVDTIANEVENEPGSLPLLSFFMTELYNELIAKNDFTEFTIADYKNVGRVAGAIRRKAKQFYEDSQQKKLLEKLILRMISLESGDYTKQKLFKKELRFSSIDESAKAENLLEQLSHATNRLIVRGGKDEIYYEPAHDYLIKAWEDPQQWVQKMGTQKFLLYDQIRKRSNAYAKSQYKNREELMFEPEYASGIAQFYPDKNNFLNANEIRFIEDSISLRKKNNRARTLALTSIISLLLLIIAGLITYIKTSAYQDETNRLLLLSQSELNTNPTHSFNLAQLVLQRDTANKIATDIISGLVSNNEVSFYRKEILNGDSILAVAISADDQLIIACGGRTINIWDTSGTLRTSIADTDNIKMKVAISPDSKYFIVQNWAGLYTKKDDVAKLYTIAGRMVDSFHLDKSTIAFLNDTTFLAGTSLFNVKGKETGRARLPEDAIYVTVSNKGDKYLVSSKDKLYLYSSSWNIIWTDTLAYQEQYLSSADKKQSLMPTAKPFSTYSINNRNIDFTISYTGFAENDNYIIAATHEGVIFKIDVANHKTLYSFSPFEGTYLGYSNDRKNTLFCFQGYQNDFNAAAVFDLDGNYYKSLKGHSSAIVSTCFYNHSNSVLTSEQNGIILLWDLQKKFKHNFSFGISDVFAFADPGNAVIRQSEERHGNGYNLISTKYSTTGNLISSDTTTLGPNENIVFASEKTSIRKTKSFVEIFHKDEKQPYRSSDRFLLAAENVIFSADNSIFAFLNIDKDTVHVYDRRLKPVFFAKVNHAEDIQFSNDNNYLLAKYDTTVNVFLSEKNIIGGYSIFSLKGSSKPRILMGTPMSAIRDIIFNNNNNVLVFYDSSILEYDLRRQKIIKLIRQDNSKMLHAFAGFNEYYFTSEQNRLRQWRQGEQVQEYYGHDEDIKYVIFSRNNKFLLTVSPPEGSARLWMTKDYYLKSGLISPLSKKELAFYGIN